VVALETACWFESSLGHKDPAHIVSRVFYLK
jgi:hypothetical protein